MGGLYQVLLQMGGKYRVRQEVMLETQGLPSSLFAWYLESSGWVIQDLGSSTQSTWPYSSREACMLPLQLSAWTISLQTLSLVFIFLSCAYILKLFITSVIAWLDHLSDFFFFNL